MAPELVKEQPYDHMTDVWALGVILYELFVGDPPYYTDSIYKLVQLIVKGPLKYPAGMPPQFKSFLSLMLVKDSRGRASWPEMLSHPFIAGTVRRLNAEDSHVIGDRNADAADASTPTALACHPQTRLQWFLRTHQKGGFEGNADTEASNATADESAMHEKLKIIPLRDILARAHGVISANESDGMHIPSSAANASAEHPSLLQSSPARSQPSSHSPPRLDSTRKEGSPARPPPRTSSRSPTRMRSDSDSSSRSDTSRPPARSNQSQAADATRSSLGQSTKSQLGQTHDSASMAATPTRSQVRQFGDVSFDGEPRSRPNVDTSLVDGISPVRPLRSRSSHNGNSTTPTRNAGKGHPDDSIDELGWGGEFVENISTVPVSPPREARQKLDDKAHDASKHGHRYSGRASLTHISDEGKSHSSRDEAKNHSASGSLHGSNHSPTRPRPNPTRLSPEDEIDPFDESSSMSQTLLIDAKPLPAFNEPRDSSSPRKSRNSTMERTAQAQPTIPASSGIESNTPLVMGEPADWFGEDTPLSTKDPAWHRFISMAQLAKDTGAVSLEPKHQLSLASVQEYASRWPRINFITPTATSPTKSNASSDSRTELKIKPAHAEALVGLTSANSRRIVQAIEHSIAGSTRSPAWLLAMVLASRVGLLFIY